MFKNNKYQVGIVIGVLVLILLGIVLFSGGGSGVGLLGEKKREKISIQKADTKLTVRADGRVAIEKGGKTSYEQWEDGKVTAFFSYFDEKYWGVGQKAEGEDSAVIFDGGNSLKLSDDDELVDELLGDGGSGGSGGGSGGDDSYFTGGGSGGSGSGGGGSLGGGGSSGGGGSGGGSQGGSGGSGGSGGEEGGNGEDGEEECLYWRLSYCVNYPSPTPSPTPTPPGLGESVDLPPTCTDLNNQTTGRTTISNELCVPPYQE
ncbi:hypothetical protein A2382_00300 [Candidatus Woesebacteria bacterium RIFOXYB1_FULL_38_16]|uniref:Uncharacterized protein n=1 Tax=Candidatus Woesebacteria bacterium RIFOXYB1_FULL_38_16 TaxID=1802538 RepID=A0A1F8CSF9_9BACT|nr:MAG: hypothetical protein A2382_00300 [Candidatus Woesebacteria bacterium RIFOXYB1_FULL_38_16]